MKFLFGYLKKYKRAFLLTGVVYLVSSAASLAMPELMSQIIETGIKTANIDRVYHLCGIMFAVALAALLLSTLGKRLNSIVSNNLAENMRNDVFQKINSLSFEEFASIGSSSLLTRTTSDISNLQEAANSIVYVFTNVPVALLGGVTLAFFKDLTLALILSAATVIVVAVVFFVVKKLYPLWERSDLYCDKQNNLVRERLSGIRVIRAFDKEEIEHEKISAATDAMADNMIKANVFGGLISPTALFVLNFITVVIIYVGAIRLGNSAFLTAGDVIAVVQYVGIAANGIMSAVWIFSWFPYLKVSSKRVGEIVDLEGLDVADDNPRKLDGDLVVNDVSFAYPNAKSNALTNVSLLARKGETISIIGGSGSGKSTLIKLLTGFYSPNDGSISLGGRDYSSLTKSDVRANVSVCLQKSMIFEGTIKDNVATARTDANDQDVLSALETARLGEFVASKDEGLSFRLSQAGTNLSGGQKQRINVARTIFRDSPVYVFDDSFSALDFLTENKLRRALNARLVGKTQIIVTQRVSTAVKTDRIYVMSDGKIVGEGNNADLLKNCEVYREIYRSQIGEDLI